MGITFQGSGRNPPLTVASFFVLVLGIPHPAVNTRDVALYQPFRNALRSPNQLVRLPTLTFHLMGRRCQEGQQNPVRFFIAFNFGFAERAPAYILVATFFFLAIAPSRWKMHARQWTCTALTPTSGKQRYARGSGLPRFRQARFPAATCSEATERR